MPNAQEQEAVLRDLYADLGRTTLRVEEKNKTNHFRELRLTWVDRRELIVRLDSGLTFLKAKGRPHWQFGVSPTVQAGELRSSRSM